VYLLTTALFVLVAGCAPRIAPPAPTPRPARSWESAELLQAIAQRREQFRSVRTLARVDYSGPDGRSGFQEAILVQRPDRLRLETLTMLGAILIVTVNENEIVGYHPREGLFLRGQRSKENLLRYTQIPLELDEITALLLGLPPVEHKRPSALIDNALVFSSNGEKRDRVAFESQLAVPTRWERVNAIGEVELVAHFTDYTTTTAGLFPANILIEAPPQAKRVQIRYEKPELNITLESHLFMQEKPPHAKEIPLEAVGG
jgi:hypothetical protein